MIDIEAGVKFIQKVKKFGEEELGLNFNNSFKEYNKQSFTAYFLYATPRHEIKSAVRNIIRRRRPYFASWFYGECYAEERRYRKKKLDTHLFYSDIYSGCQITESLLKQELATQIYNILHEGCHTTLKTGWLTMPMTYSLEESLAHTVGVHGTLLFAQKYYKDDRLVADVQKLNEEFYQLIQFWQYGYTLLTTAYKTQSVTEKELNRINSMNMIRGEQHKYSIPWLQKKLKHADNNAFFLRYSYYFKYYDLALNVLRNTGFNLKKTISIFKQVSRRETEAIQFLEQYA